MNKNSYVNRYGFITPEKTTTPSTVLHTENARLEKWLSMLENWDRYARSRRLKKRIRKGIPSGIRGVIWYKLSDVERFKSSYRSDLYTSLQSSEADPRSIEIIRADLRRTFPKNVFFQDEFGTSQLFRVLKAYSVFDPQVGYMQGMSYIAGLFLMFLSEEDCFWLFATVMAEYEIRENFLPKMPLMNSSFYVSNALLRHNFPKLFRRLNDIGLSPSMFATQWFMAGFTVNFPIETVLRIWDCFLFEKQKIFFRIYLAIMKVQYQALMKADFEGAMILLRQAKKIDTEELVKVAFKVRLKRRTINRLKKDYLKNPKKKYLNWTSS